MLFGRKEAPQPFISKWQKTNWDGIQGYSRSSSGEDVNYWDFSADLPEDTDPGSVNLAYSAKEGTESTGYYTVSYRPKNVLLWKLLEVPRVTEKGNYLMNFSAHTRGGLERAVGSSNVDNQANELEL